MKSFFRPSSPTIQTDVRPDLWRCLVGRLLSVGIIVSTVLSLSACKVDDEKVINRSLKKGLGHIGTSLLWHDFKKADKQLTQLEAFCEHYTEQGLDAHIPTIQEVRADALILAQDYDGARKALKELVKGIEEKEGKKSLKLPPLWFKLADVYVKREDPYMAAEYLEEAYALLREQKEPDYVLLGKVLVYKARLELDKGDAEKAFRMNQEGDKLLVANGGKFYPYRAWVYFNEGMYKLKRDNIYEADKKAQEAAQWAMYYTQEKKEYYPYMLDLLLAYKKYVADNRIARNMFYVDSNIRVLKAALMKKESKQMRGILYGLFKMEDPISESAPPPKKPEDDVKDDQAIF